MRYSVFFLLLTALLISNGFQISVAGPELVLTVSIDVAFAEEEGTAIVRMTGEVLDPYDQTVKSAAIFSPNPLVSSGLLVITSISNKPKVQLQLYQIESPKSWQCAMRQKIGTFHPLLRKEMKSIKTSQPKNWYYSQAA